MSYRLVARDPRDTSGGNINPVRIPTCNHCHADLDPDYDDMESDFCEDCADDTCEMTSDCCAGSIIDGEFCSVCREACGPGSCARCES